MTNVPNLSRIVIRTKPLITRNNLERESVTDGRATLKARSDDYTEFRVVKFTRKLSSFIKLGDIRGNWQVRNIVAQSDNISLCSIANISRCVAELYVVGDGRDSQMCSDTRVFAVSSAYPESRSQLAIIVHFHFKTFELRLTPS